ncbi:MAG: response regulator [Polyangiales bacterium]
MTGSAPEIAPKPALRVLLIEDSLDDADLTLDELRKMYAVEHARVDDDAGMRGALLEGGWQLILCDYAMPGFGAMAALSIVKAHHLDVPFIIVSGVIGEETAVEAMRAGAHDFLAKGRLARLGPAVERELREAVLREDRRTMQQQLLLSDRLVQIGIIAAGVAHEINNPLAYVLGNVTYALEELRSATTDMDRDQVIEALAQAREGAERIRAIAGDLRVFSRHEDGTREPVDLRRVLQSSINMCINQIKQRATLTRDYHDVSPVVASENRLGQVFLNLLVNAAEAIPEGEPRHHEIRVRLRQEAGLVIVEIVDSGVGLAPQAREHVFQPFFTTKPKGTGTGLGLSISRKIVEELGGELTVHPNPDHGVTFRVQLPALERPALEPVKPIVAPEKPARTEPPAERRRVLVIDDEPAIVNVVKRLLRNEYEMVGVVGGRAALELLQRDQRFDVVFCDLMMPEVDGRQVMAALSELAPTLLQRLVFVTGGAFTPETQQFLTYVDNIRIQKPFDQKSLRTAVSEVIERCV